MFILVSHARIYKNIFKIFYFYTQKIAQNSLEKYYVQKSDYYL